MMPLLLLGSIPGVLLGARLSPHMPVYALRLGIAGLLVLSGIKLGL
jgi:uncharacterized membrane protein YfcA